MDSYEFAYFGRDLESLENAIATWCSQRKCRLETTELLEGATFRISGPEATIQEAIDQLVRRIHSRAIRIASRIVSSRPEMRTRAPSRRAAEQHDATVCLNTWRSRPKQANS